MGEINWNTSQQRNNLQLSVWEFYSSKRARAEFIAKHTHELEKQTPLFFISASLQPYSPLAEDVVSWLSLLFSWNSHVIWGWWVVLCPKCGSQMLEDKHLQALGSEVELVSKDIFLGDKLKVFFCEKCGYIESYRDRNRRPWNNTFLRDQFG